MSGYVLSILGIVLLGILIDVIVPSGNINKYIKSIYSIFIVSVIISPVVNFVANKNDYKLTYVNYEIDSKLLEYVYKLRVENEENNIEIYLEEEGFSKIDIIINYSINNNEIQYNSCSVNLQNLEISADKLNINKYEFIKQAVKSFTNLTYEEIMIYEWWKSKKANCQMVAKT